MKFTPAALCRQFATLLLFLCLLFLMIDEISNGRWWLAVACGAGGLIGVALLVRDWIRPGFKPGEDSEILQAILETGGTSCYLLDDQSRFAMALPEKPEYPIFPGLPLIGHTCDELWGKEFANPFQASLNQVFADGKPRTIRYPLVCGERKRFFEARIRLFKPSNGNHSWALMVVSNISVQVRFEKMQAGNIRWFRTLFNKLSEAVVLVDKNNIIRGLNARTLEQYGYGKAQLLDQPIGKLFAAKQSQSDLKMVADSENPVRVSESLHLHGDGSVFPVEIRASNIRLDNQDYCLALIRDVSFQKEMEDQQRRFEKNLVNQNAMRDKLFSIIAHDLRGPVGTLRAFLTSYKQDRTIFTPQEFEEFFIAMGNSINATWDLLENLLSWVRNQFETLSINQNPVSLLETCRIVSAWLNPLAIAKNQKIEIDLVIDHVIMTDSNMLQTVIRNLLGNAIKFTPHGGTIQLRVLANEMEAGIVVADTGSGIPAQKIRELFLLRGGTSTEGTAGEKGSGLGLFLCQEIITRLSGHIAVDSSPKGTAFTVWLPASVEGDLDLVEELGEIT